MFHFHRNFAKANGAALPDLKPFCKTENMEHFLRIFLPVYFILYFAIAFVAKSLLVARRTGKNPIVFPKDGSAYALVGFYFKLVLIGLLVYMLLFAFVPAIPNGLQPVTLFNNTIIKYIGLGLLAFALLWTVMAQAHMKDSWRIGIDTASHTELITTGLFRFSRNPIFLGMLISLLGLFFTTPNALTAFFLIIGYILIQIQIRLEEAFLAKRHGETYLHYRQTVRRLI